MIIPFFFPPIGLIAAVLTYFIVYLDHAHTTAQAMMEVTKLLLAAS